MKKSERKEKSKQEFLKKHGFGGTPTPDVGAIPHPPKGVPIPDPNAPRKPYK